MGQSAVGRPWFKEDASIFEIVEQLLRICLLPEAI